MASRQKVSLFLAETEDDPCMMQRFFSASASASAITIAGKYAGTSHEENNVV